MKTILSLLYLMILPKWNQLLIKSNKTKTNLPSQRFQNNVFALKMNNGRVGVLMAVSLSSESKHNF